MLRTPTLSRYRRAVLAFLVVLVLLAALHAAALTTAPDVPGAWTRPTSAVQSPTAIPTPAWWQALPTPRPLLEGR